MASLCRSLAVFFSKIHNAPFLSFLGSLLVSSDAVLEISPKNFGFLCPFVVSSLVKTFFVAPFSAFHNVRAPLGH